MKGISFLSITFIIIVLTVGCRKRKDDPIHDGKHCLGDKCYILSGQLLHAADSTPIANTVINLYRYPSTRFLGKKKLLARTRSNEMGVYSIIFDGSSYAEADNCYSGFGNYRLEAYKDLMFGKFFSQDNLNEVARFNLCSINYNTPLIQNLYLFEGANLSVIIREKSLSQLLIKQISISSGGKKIIYFAEAAPVKERKISNRLVGNDSCRIEAVVEVNGEIKQQSKTVFLPANSSNEVAFIF